MVNGGREQRGVAKDSNEIDRDDCSGRERGKTWQTKTTRAMKCRTERNEKREKNKMSHAFDRVTQRLNAEQYVLHLAT